MTTTTTRSLHRPVRITIGTAAAALLLLAGCGDDDANDVADPTADAPEQPATDGEGRNGGDAVVVTMIDYAYEGLPDEIEAGTQLRVENASDDELHELVAVKLPDGDDRPVTQIVPADLGSLMAGGPPTAVLLALPGSDEQIEAVGDGTFADAGRYVIFCAIPTGIDPQEYLDAAAATPDGPPQVEGGGPPHFAEGMLADLVVTGS